MQSNRRNYIALNAWNLTRFLKACFSDEHQYFFRCSRFKEVKSHVECLGLHWYPRQPPCMHYSTFPQCLIPIGHELYVGQVPFSRNLYKKHGCLFGSLIAISTPLPFISTSIEVVFTFRHIKHPTDVTI